MNWLVKYVKICWHELLCMFHSIDVFFMFPMTFLNEKMDLSKNSWSAIHTGLVVWNIFYFSIYWEESSHLTNIFQYGWNHQPVIYYPWMHLGLNWLNHCCEQIGMVILDVINPHSNSIWCWYGFDPPKRLSHIHIYGIYIYIYICIYIYIYHAIGLFQYKSKLFG